MHEMATEQQPIARYMYPVHVPIQYSGSVGKINPHQTESVYMFIVYMVYRILVVHSLSASQDVKVTQSVWI